LSANLVTAAKDQSIEPQMAFRERIVIPLWSVMVWLVVMNTTMFNVALPRILADFALSPATASWIVTGYSIVFAISTVTYSRLSDYLPISRLLTVGVILLGVSSLIGFFSHDFYWLLFARLLQATGAASAPGLGMVLVARYVPLSRRGKSMALISSAASLGFGLGPVIGGSITQFLGWNYLFIVTGLVLLLLPSFRKFLPKEKPREGTFDLLGAALLGAGVTLLLLFLTNFSWAYLLLCILSLLTCWKHVQRSSNPFILPELFQNRQFVYIMMMGFAAFFTHFSTLFLMPIILSTLFDKGSAQIGMMIFPGAMMSAVAAIFIGRMIDRFGNPLLIGLGHVLLVLSILLFCFYSSVSPYMILISYMFMSVGFTAVTSSLGNEITRILPEEQIGAGMGLAQLIQFFGGASGVAVTGLLLDLTFGMESALIYQRIDIGLSLLLMVSFGLFGFYMLRSRSE
jgi:DHA2 family metal-tetracycline-proton antiporter-like MFS transporter